MKKISAFAELLYVVSNFEKGRVKSSGAWRRKYVNSLKKSLEIMALLTNLISENKEISQDQMHSLQEFIHENKGVIFSGEGNINALLNDKNDTFSWSVICARAGYIQAESIIAAIILKKMITSFMKDYVIFCYAQMLQV